jgi:glycogen phosphorylase
MPPFVDRPLPDPLHILHELALDLRWSWNHYGDALWRRINPEVWSQTQNPVSVMQLTSTEHLQTLAQQQDFLALLDDISSERHEHLTRQSWYQQHYGQAGPRGIAYFSMEFGLCEALPLYAGGLGVLAGDYLKTASDLGVPLVGVGLLYQQGYFHQSLGPDGRQQENYLYNDPAGLPIAPLLQADGSWLHVCLELFSRHIHFRIWRAQVGRVTLYLLDSNDPANQPNDRCITSKLYGGGTELRLLQEIALGIGGWRLIEQLGLSIDICHLNEGHAAFATLERARYYSQKHGLDFWQSLWATRVGNLFTTHTPVAAGFDCYPETLLSQYATHYAQLLGPPLHSLMQLGRANPEDANEGFNMAYLAMRTCGYSNGVSQLHGQVSQQIFQPLFPRWPRREVPVGFVTNGVHMPTWDSPAADALWTKAYGRHRWRGDLAVFDQPAVAPIGDEDLAKLASQGRAQLVQYVRQRLEREDEDNSGPQAGNRLDPEIFTLGFARRFTEYKRPDLLLADPERLVRLLTNPERPVQLIIAGKAHPADEQGKRALQRWQDFLRRPEVRQRAVFIEDYDLALAQQLVQGVDLWINTPRRPWEACGTSGMKVLVNGGLNLSTLDGWWAEAYQSGVGWALGVAEQKDSVCNLSINEQDACDALQLYQLLEDEVIPGFYARDQFGLARAWLSRIRASMASLTPRFSSNRMLRDYLQQYYLPAARGIAMRQADENALARQLHRWQQQLQAQWPHLHINSVSIKNGAIESGAIESGAIESASLKTAEQRLHLEATVYLAQLDPTSISVQVIADPSADSPAQIFMLQLQHSSGPNHHYAGDIITSRPAEDFTLRLIPAHAQAVIPQEISLIKWQR